MYPELAGPGSDFDNFILFMPDDRAARYAESLEMYESIAAVMGYRYEDGGEGLGEDEEDSEEDADEYESGYVSSDEPQPITSAGEPFAEVVRRGHTPPPPELLRGGLVWLPRQADRDLRKYARHEQTYSCNIGAWSAIDIVLAIPRGVRFLAGRGFAVFPSTSVADLARRWTEVVPSHDDAVGRLTPYFGGAGWGGQKAANDALTTISKVLSNPPGTSLVFVSLPIYEPT